MDKKQKNILLWVLTWAGLLLLVLYSPLGSPELYSHAKYYAPYQGVVFNGSEIQNSMQIKNKRTTGTPSLNQLSVPDNGQQLKRVFAYSISNAPKPSSSNSGNQVVLSQDNNVVSNSNNTVDLNATYNGFVARNSKSVENQNFGLPSLSTDLGLLADNNLNKQSAGTGLAGTTDPGGDPTGNPIPVGDGWVFLIALSIIYTFLKMKKKIFSSIKIHN